MWEIIDNILWQAIRYAHGRSTYAPSMVRSAINALKGLYPDFKLKPDDTIKSPKKDFMDDMRLREDYLDDLFGDK